METQNQINFDAIMQEAILLIVRRALEQASLYGLGSQHHFYISFLTQSEGVGIPEYLKVQHPHELTIVLQNRFWNLKVHHDYFQVDLSFNKKLETLTIPFDAISGFSDPSIPIGFKLHQDDLEPTEDEGLEDVQEEVKLFKLPKDLPPRGKLHKKPAGKNQTENSNPDEKSKPASPPSTHPSDNNPHSDKNNVVSLDKFRKK